jgi:ADP-ribosylarginine hydrolase
VSDDTLFHLALAKSLLNPSNDLYETIKDNFMEAYKFMLKENEKGKYRFMGITTQKYIEYFDRNQDGRTLPYDSMAGGSGGSMRTPCIGLIYFGEHNRDKLYEVAIESSRLTHNSPIGYLGGLVSALFTAYAIEGIDLFEWPFLLLKLLESDTIKKYIRKKYEDDEKKDYDDFVRYWKLYVETKFVNKQPVRTKSQYNLIFRTRYHYDNFTQGTRGRFIGDSGFSSVIMAYDSLIDSNSCWETLIVYSALHSGDGDTVASIACAWFGALYGFKNIPDSNLKYLELKNELFNVGKNLYKTFGKIKK